MADLMHRLARREQRERNSRIALWLWAALTAACLGGMVALAFNAGW